MRLLGKLALVALLLNIGWNMSDGFFAAVAIEIVIASMLAVAIEVTD